MDRELKIVNNIGNKNYKGITINLDGNNIKTKEDLYKAFERSIFIPDYFGENWDAFWDIITDSRVIRDDITVIIYNYDNMFVNYEDKMIFSKILLDWLYTSLISVNILVYIIKSDCINK